jgi:hypothetical protein
MGQEGGEFTSADHACQMRGVASVPTGEDTLHPVPSGTGCYKLAEGEDSTPQRDIGQAQGSHDVGSNWAE